MDKGLPIYLSESTAPGENTSDYVSLYCSL